MNIIITGASRGIGFATAKAYAASTKHSIVAIARNEEGLENLKRECLTLNPEAQIYTIPFDLRNADLNILIDKIQGFISGVDILINNAGALVNKSFETLSEEDFDLLFDVNVKSVFRLIQSLLPKFNSHCHILNISSMGGFQGSAKFAGLSLYSASKGALAVLTECLAEEFKERTISVNCLALGAVQTEMLANAFPGYKAPLSSAEMALFIHDFSLNGHKYFNGKILPVSFSTP